MMYDEKVKDVFMQIRISKELRDKFKTVCKSKAINSSELVRQLVTQWITEQQDSNNPHNRGTDL